MAASIESGYKAGDGAGPTVAARGRGHGLHRFAERYTVSTGVAGPLPGVAGPATVLCQCGDGGLLQRRQLHNRTDQSKPLRVADFVWLWKETSAGRGYPSGRPKIATTVAYL